MPKLLQNLDVELLRTFSAIAEARSFTRAAEKLMRQQSTISLQIKRLEDALSQKLLERSPRAVRLTPEGEAVLAYAQRILDLNDEVVSLAREPLMHGVVRLGTPEDFATHHLPDILQRFVQAYPSVALEVSCDLTLNLLDGFREGRFDLVLVKRDQTAKALAPKTGGIRVWREPLVWVSGHHDYVTTAAQTGAPLPLIVSPEPCVYRRRATQSFDRARRPWRVAYTCTSLAGSIAAVRAGLGLAVLPKTMVPHGLHVIDSGPLPDLKDTEIALLVARGVSPPVAKLRDHIIRSLGDAA